VSVRVGQVLGDRYRLEELIGQGGTSTVWRAADTVLERQVAVKVLAGASLARQAYHSSIRTDAMAAARLSHPNVATVFDFAEYADSLGEQIPFVVMELLHGRPLSQRLREGPLDPPLALRVCAQVAGALAAAHASGLVHRDVKPGNVVLTPGGAKVIDFGLAAAVGQNDDAPGARLFGTAAYLAPERLAGAPVTAASDVYALGLLLFRALTSQLPWPAETVTEMLVAHVYAEPGPLPDLPGVPAAVHVLARQCLAKDPSNRPSARAAAIVLAEAAKIEPPLGEDQIPLMVRPRSTDAGLTRPGRPGADHAASDRTGPNRAAGAQLVAASAATPSGPNDQTPDSGGLVAPPRRVLLLLGAAAGAVAVAAFAVPALLNRPPAGTAGLPTPAIESAAPASAGQVGPARSNGVPKNPAGGQTSLAGSPGTMPVNLATPAVVDATSPAATPTPPTGSQPQTFSSAGGSVTASCQGAMSVLDSWTPKPTYSVNNVEAGPAKVARITLQSTAERTVVATRVTCDSGVPIANTTTSDLEH
jgi:serine/threonine-protein kinase